MDIIAEVDDELKASFAQELQHLQQEQSQLWSFFQTCESPLEQKLLRTLLDYFPGYPCEWQGTHILAPNWGAPHYLGFEVRIYAQRAMPTDLKKFVQGESVKRYRADFLLRLSRWNHTSGQTDYLANLVIEVDEQNYHQQTEEQDKQNKLRDIQISQAGYTILRFSGTELFEQMEETIEKVTDFLIRKIGDAVERQGLRFY